LHGQHGEVRALDDVDAEFRSLPPHPREIAVARASIDDGAETRLFEKVNDQVVDDAARLIEHAAIERLAGHLQLVDVVGEKPLEELPHARTLEIGDAHVGDVEDARAATHGVVLGELGAVLQRHVPAAEVDDPGAELLVQVE